MISLAGWSGAALNTAPLAGAFASSRQDSVRLPIAPSQNHRGLAHFAAGTIAAMVAEQNVPVPLSGDGSWMGSKPVLGPIAPVTESESGLEFIARVDTGAKTCSIHAEELSVIDGSDTMQQNIGKTIRFRIANRNGQSSWLERPIAEVSYVKNSNGAEWRYLVPMTLACEGTQKEVLVSLNDRSDMNYAMLVGRNLLAGKFLVDVAAEE
ncbi:MAG: RimK/LysX family protein [Planctomycetes bacterium]|nr:RimK/LysX family protein [Planctomycetota bacterium]